jgi:hypothetical protein
MEFETGDWVGLRLTSGDLVRGQVFLVGLEGLTVLEDEEFRAVAYSEIGEIADSEGSRTPVPIQSGHPFRSNPDTRSGVSGHLGAAGLMR